MILKLNNKEKDMVMLALVMADVHYRGRMADSKTRVLSAYYNKLAETVKSIMRRIEPGRKT